MGLGNFFRSLTPGNDHELAATQYAGRESASDEASRKRREKYRARVSREGDSNNTRLPRRYRNHNSASN